MAAVSHTFWTQTVGNTRLDPLCNQCIDVTHNGKTIQVPIQDKCLSCDPDRVDLSRPAFAMLGDPDKGRLEGAVYEIVDCDGNTTLFASSISVWPRRMTFGLTLSFVAFILAATAALAYLGVKHYMTGKEWEIPFEQVQMEEQIGQGSFGVVFRAYRYGPVAVKQLFAAKPPPSQRRAFRNEIRLLKSLRHTNVLGLLGIVTEPKLAIVTDWCHGSLYHQIHVAESEYESHTIYRFCKQIAEGVHYLHSKGVLHRDLKSGNILLTEANGTTLKICDFGLSTVKTPRASDKKTAKSPVGSVLWMAPEIINPRLKKGGSPYTVQSDAYAFGICMYELLSRRLPYLGYERDQITYLVGAGLLHPETEPSFKGETDEIACLMRSCLAYHSDERPTFDEICAIIRNAERNYPFTDEKQKQARTTTRESGYVTVPQYPKD
ncbi:RAF protein [Aphelenchoides avenae]|nr:RAF protein [Aphelenchus avenae]